MTVDSLRAFFEAQGTTSTIEQDKNGNVTADFKHRGVPYRATSYADGTSLFEIACRYNSPPPTTADSLKKAITDTFESFSIVRFRQFEENGRHIFVCLGEQIEPSPENLAEVFWPLLDLVTKAGDFCYSLLETKKAEEAGSSGKSDFDTNLEKMLAAGCQTDDAKLTADPAAERSVVASVFSSLALIADTDSTATAFCFYSNDSESLYLTCAHAVGDSAEVTLYRQWPEYEKHKAEVKAKGSSGHRDLAVLSVASPSRSYLSLAPSQPQEGDSIALAGYPKVQFDVAAEYGELVPSFHQGTVSALIDRGAIILHDALSRPGNSGGPLFDLRSGKVVGVVQGGWESDGENVAVGVAKAVIPFLEGNAVTLKSLDSRPTPNSSTETKKRRK